MQGAKENEFGFGPASASASASASSRKASTSSSPSRKVSETFDGFGDARSSASNPPSDKLTKKTDEKGSRSNSSAAATAKASANPPPEYTPGGVVNFTPDKASLAQPTAKSANLAPSLLAEDIRVGDRDFGYKTTLGKGEQGGKTGGIPGIHGRVNQMTSDNRSTLITHQPGRMRSPDGFAP